MVEAELAELAELAEEHRCCCFHCLWHSSGAYDHLDRTFSAEMAVEVVVEAVDWVMELLSLMWSWSWANSAVVAAPQNPNRSAMEPRKGSWAGVVGVMEAAVERKRTDHSAKEPRKGPWAGVVAVELASPHLRS